MREATINGKITSRFDFSSLKPGMKVRTEVLLYYSACIKHNIPLGFLFYMWQSVLLLIQSLPA